MAALLVGLLGSLAACNMSPLDWSGTPADLARPGNGRVGAACTRDADCATGACFAMTPFSGGYCNLRIGECPAPGGTGEPCPAGSSCINPGMPATGGLDYCLANCAGDGDCRTAEGYRCCSHVEGHTGHFCAPSTICR